MDYKVCANCHLLNAQGSGSTPELAGQDSDYLKKQIRDIQNGARQSAIMLPFVTHLTATDIDDINAYLATLPPGNDSAEPQLFDRGKLIYHAGMPTGAPSCAACHGPAGKGISGVPALAGQHAAYIIAQLQAFDTGTRSNDQHAIMRDIAKKLSNEDRKAVASYISGIRPS